MRRKTGTDRKKHGFSGGTEEPRKQKIRIAIVDENPVCRRGLRDLLAEAGHEIIAEMEYSEPTLKVLTELKPDVTVLASLSGANGSLQLATWLNARKSPTHIVMLTSLVEERPFNQAMSLGVKGYVLKGSPEREIMDCVKVAASGEPYVSPTLTNFLLRRHGGTEKLRREQPGLGQLTVGERRILRGIALGKTSRQIAAERGISLRTVDSHRANISEKLQLRGRNRLLHFALEHRDALSHLD
jgi:DNA-binding NarL/FixJ family response regulator